ncbi:MAG: EAL domain-containing protein [Cellulomonas sp.]
MHRLTNVLVLTPSLSGEYFGELLAGLAREVAGTGGRLLVVKTLAAVVSADQSGVLGDFATPVAWSHVDGVVSITTAVDAPYLRLLRERGAAVVLVSTQVPGFAAPIAMPDNFGGTFAAVEHLIGHGHTRIGFVGNFDQSDVRDRYSAYLEALSMHDLVADPSQVYEVPNSSEASGERVAGTLLAGADRPSAVMVATDRTAIGMMRALSVGGLVLPDDLAIVAFDNIEAGAFAVPPLSSVNQRFDEVGALAGRLVLAKVRGEVVPDTAFTSPSVALAVRESCGCSTDSRPGHDDHDRAGGWLLDSSPELLRDALQDVLCGALLTGSSTNQSVERDAVVATVDEVERLLRANEGASPADLRALTAALHRLTSRPEALRRIMDAVTDYAVRIGNSAATDSGRATPESTAVAATLWKLQTGALLHQAETTELAIQEQYVVDAGLLDAVRADPRELAWLNHTHVAAGVLGLWTGDPASGQLRIEGTYDPDLLLDDLVGLEVDGAHFPPPSLIAATTPSKGQVCVVVPVQTAERDWGLFAVAGTIDTTSVRETYQHWATLLAASMETQRLHEEVRRNALYDALTRLPNRRLFLDRLEHALTVHHRDGTPFAVLFLDLDGFKLINDSLGHPMGDRVLTAVGDRVLRELRTVDTGARFGGDEFAILLHDTEPSDVLMVAQRVQRALAAVLDLDGHELTIRASIGIATSTIAYTSAEDVLRDADTAMYRAKTAEPGTIAIFDTVMHKQAIQLQELHDEIQVALDDRQFEVYYQPIVNLATGRTDRFEALVRWNHPTRGLVMPDEFIPVMEKSGLIVRLGHRIIDEVGRQLAVWGPSVLNVSINLSDREFWHQDLLRYVLEVLDRHQIAPARLTFEITETVIMRRPEVALRLMRDLHEAGLRLHIDDFGTGYTSLEILHRFPVDAFKIDRSYMRSLAPGNHTAQLITALVEVGRSLGLAVVAEGVETTEQLAFLQRIGCATGQGYLFMPAVTNNHATELLDRDLSDPPDHDPRVPLRAQFASPRPADKTSPLHFATADPQSTES